jgi:hypothetical protein
MADWVMPAREKLLNTVNERSSPTHYAPHLKRSVISFTDGSARPATISELMGREDWWDKNQ